MSENNWKIPPDGGHMDLADGIYFQNMNSLELEARLKENDLLIIPVGSTEAHGPHACYGEDTFLVTRMAEAVAQKTGCTVSQPKGVVGKATLADEEKARPGVEALLDYLVKLHDDIMERFPPGVLPDVSLVTQRFTQEEVDEYQKGPLDGGKHLYTIAWPPR